MMKYTFYVTTYQSGGEGKGDTKTEFGIYRKTNLYSASMQTYRNIDHTYNNIKI